MPARGTEQPDNKPVIDQNALELKETAGLSQGQIVRRRFRRHAGAMISMVVLLLIIILATTSIGWGPIPGWWKYTYYETAPFAATESPTLKVWPFSSGFAWGDHPFGVDNTTGLDLFAGVMRGTQQTIVVIVIMGILSTVIGVVLGALAGYYRGMIGAVIMRFTDLIITLPVIMITAVMGFVLHTSGIFAVALAIGLLNWTGLARLVRGEFLSLREREFVDAARVAGASDARIIFKHILPNTVGVIVVNTTLLMGGGILLEAALSFLGFGIKYPDLSLGSIISNYASAFQSRPFLFLWPGVFIIVIVLCINFIGDGLRDAFDPRQKRVPKARQLNAAGKTSDSVAAADQAIGSGTTG